MPAWRDGSQWRFARRGLSSCCTSWLPDGVPIFVCSCCRVPRADAEVRPYRGITGERILGERMHLWRRPVRQSDWSCRYRTGSARRVLRIAWPTSGIVEDVLVDALKRGLIADDVFVVATLPEATPQPSCVCPLVSANRTCGGQRLEPPNKARQCCRGGPLRPPWGGVRVDAAVLIEKEHDGMKMVWHDYKCIEAHIGAMGWQFAPRILHNPSSIAEFHGFATDSA